MGLSRTLRPNHEYLSWKEALKRSEPKDVGAAITQGAFASTCWTPRLMGLCGCLPATLPSGAPCHCILSSWYTWRLLGKCFPGIPDALSNPLAYPDVWIYNHNEYENIPGGIAAPLLVLAPEQVFDLQNENFTTLQSYVIFCMVFPCTMAILKVQISLQIHRGWLAMCANNF